MSEFLTKQTEWHQQAVESDDFKLQVGRPQSDENWRALAFDVNKKLQLNESERLLDVGCGSGLLLSHLAQNCASIAGIDYAEAMVKKAKTLLPQGEFHCGEANQLPFATNSFDKLLSYSIFHYFPSEQYALDVINEMIRVVKPGGMILLGDLLDAEYEAQIKGSSDLDYEQQIPYIHRYSQWRFYDLQNLIGRLEDTVRRTEILAQPSGFALSGYRKDIRLWL